MHGILPMDATFRRNMRFKCFQFYGQACLRPDKIELADKIVVSQQIRYRWPNLIGDGGHNADNLALFGILQVTQFVVGIEHLCRLDENGLSRSRLIVDETLDAPLERSRYGNTQTAIADGHLGILFHQTLLLGNRQQFVDFSIGFA